MVRRASPSLPEVLVPLEVGGCGANADHIQAAIRDEVRCHTTGSGHASVIEDTMVSVAAAYEQKRKTSNSYNGTSLTACSGRVLSFTSAS